MSDEPIELDTPWRRDPDELAARLTEWARATIAPGLDRLRGERARATGCRARRCCSTCATTTGAIEHYVARVEPLPEVYPVFPEYNLDLQKRCMELVRAQHRRARARSAVRARPIRVGSARRSS